jgi:hypothetical protein
MWPVKGPIVSLLLVNLLSIRDREQAKSNGLP